MECYVTQLIFSNSDKKKVRQKKNIRLTFSFIYVPSIYVRFTFNENMQLMTRGMAFL